MNFRTFFIPCTDTERACAVKEMESLWVDFPVQLQILVSRGGHLNYVNSLQLMGLQVIFVA